MTHNDFRNICRTTFFLRSPDADPHRDALLTWEGGKGREREREKESFVGRATTSEEREKNRRIGEAQEGWENPFSRFRPPSVYKIRGWKKADRAYKWGIEPSGSKLRPTTIRRHAPPWGSFKSTRDTHLETCPGQGPSIAWLFKHRHRNEDTEAPLRPSCLPPPTTSRVTATWMVYSSFHFRLHSRVFFHSIGLN